jgi:hypothetical protein
MLPGALRPSGDGTLGGHSGGARGGTRGVHEVRQAPSLLNDLVSH